jgi:hypothetical protein
MSRSFAAGAPITYHLSLFTPAPLLAPEKKSAVALDELRREDFLTALIGYWLLLNVAALLHGAFRLILACL